MSILDKIIDNKQFIVTYFVTWIVIIVSVLLLSWLYNDEFTSGSFKTVLMAQAAAVIILGFLANPVCEYLTDGLFVFVWSICLAIAFVIIILLSSIAFSADLYINTFIAVFLLSFFLFSFSRIVYIKFSNKQGFAWQFFLILQLLTAMPVWLAPWVEELATTMDKLNLIIWSSPMSYFATALDFDYLRSQWFYKNTPYGMLRYDYPSLLSSHLCLASLSLCLFVLGSWLNYKKHNYSNH